MLGRIAGLEPMPVCKGGGVCSHMDPGSSCRVDM